MAKKRRRRPQVTCYCNAYAFPHRIGGGKCSGADWAAGYWEIDGSACTFCNENQGDSCGVAEGRESYRECVGYQEYLHQGSTQRLPQAVEDVGEQLYEQYLARYG